MNSLLLYLGPEQKLDQQRAIASIQKIGVRELKDEVGNVFACAYDFGDDSTIIRLAEDLETISIVGSGDAAMNAAFLIQRNYLAPLRMVDLDYTFDIELKSIPSVQTLRELVATAAAQSS